MSINNDEYDLDVEDEQALLNQFATLAHGAYDREMNVKASDYFTESEIYNFSRVLARRKARREGQKIWD